MLVSSGREGVDFTPFIDGWTTLLPATLVKDDRRILDAPEVQGANRVPPRPIPLSGLPTVTHVLDRVLGRGARGCGRRGAPTTQLVSL